MTMKNLTTFKKGLLVYGLVWLAIMLSVWFVAWTYAAAYEMAEPVGAMNDYLEEQMPARLEEAVSVYCEEQANAYQSAEKLYAELMETVVGGEWTYRKSKAYTSAAPVYTLYCGGNELGTVSLTAGKANALDFGLVPWEVQDAEVNLALLERTVTVVAPVDVDVKLNGSVLSAAAETASYFPMFAEYEPTIRHPMELQVYRVDGMVTSDVTVTAKGHTVMQAEEADTWYVLPNADETAQAEMERVAGEFVEAYLMFTSNAGSFGNVQRYLAPEGELVDRLRRSLDGMSWVHYTTGKILETEISNIEYYGNVATFDAAYELKLKSGDMAGNMHVIMVQGAYGWRVSDIELF